MHFSLHIKPGDIIIDLDRGKYSKKHCICCRVNLTIALEPLSIPESSAFLTKLGMQLSDYDTYKLLSILGGVPWYLEQLSPSFTADENIKQLAIGRSGLLVTEFDRIFHDLFTRKCATYKKILDSLNDGARTLSEIRQSIEFTLAVP